MPLVPQQGDIVDRSYRLLDQLGEGGMGTVYKAVQLVNGQVLALKLISQRLLVDEPSTGSKDMAYRLALAHEFQTLASLHHPNVIRVQSYGFDDTYSSYFTMELLDTKQSILDAGQDQTEEHKIQLIAQLLRALSYIHRRGVIHRDIKPGNVLVVGDEVKLLDFGIAVAKAQSAEFAGTIDYMAPELLRGSPASTASDLYAVGVLLHQLLLGRFPSTGVEMDQVLSALLGEDSDIPTAAPGQGPPPELQLLDEPSQPSIHVPPVTAEIPGPLGEVVAKLLAKDPAERYSDAHDALHDLAAAVPYQLTAETAATRESFLRATMLIGRDTELATLTVGLQRAKDNGGSAFLIGGESGVGKSRLLAELRTLALVHGLWVSEGQSVTEGGYYYQEWLPLMRALCFRGDMTDAEASILKDLVPDISELLGREIPNAPAVKPDAAQARIVRTLVDLLSRQTKPLLFILEDLQWARSESLALLTQLDQYIPKLPLLLVGSFRSDECPQLPQSLPSMHVIQLRRLDAHNIARLSESMLGAVGQQPELVAYLERQTEGNVFFLIEVVRALGENAGELALIGDGVLPDSVLTVGIERFVERRVEQVPAQFEPLLKFSATLGRKLDLPVMEHAFPNVPLRMFLIECANAAVLESKDSGWHFAHNKLRETILRRLDGEQRKELHRQVAEAIESTYSGVDRDAMSAVLAFHFQQADVLDKALTHYAQAGDNAAKLYLLDEAQTHYAAAQSIIATLADSAELRRLHVDLLLKQVQVGLFRDATPIQLGRLNEARQLMEALIGTGTASTADRLRMARVDYQCGQTYRYAGQQHEAIRYYRRVLPIARELGDQELLVIPSFVTGSALALAGHFGQAREILGQAVEPMLQYSGPSLESRRCIMTQSMALAASGRCREAIAAIERARSLASPQEPVFFQIPLTGLHAAAAVLMVDWPKALYLAEGLLETSKAGGEAFYQYMALDITAWAQSHLGYPAEAVKTRARAVQVRQSSVGGGLADWFDAAEADILLQNGNVEEALRQAQKVAARSKELALPFSHAVAERIWACAIARRGGAMEEVCEHLQSSIEISRGSEQIANIALAERAWAEVSRERCDEAAAKQHFEKALRLFEDGGYEYALQETLHIMSL